MTQYYYRINAGHLAVDNGAVAPLSKLTRIAELLGQKVGWGEYYGQDYLLVPENPSDKQVVEEILTEEKLVWEVVDRLPPTQPAPHYDDAKGS